MLKKLCSSGMAWIWISVLVIIIDHASKVLVLRNLEYYQPVKILPVFNLMLSYNTGAAFSFLNSASGWQNIFLGSVAVIVSVIIISWLTKLSSQERWLNIGLCLILGGALANAFDRVLYGHVIDFLSFYWRTWHFAIFNLADSAINIGAFMLAVYWLFSRRVKNL